MRTVDEDKPKPIRPMQTRRGFTIVTTEFVEYTNDHNQRQLKHPYAQDLPLYRADTPDSEAMYRVFSRERYALKYIERFLKADDYRVVPVVLSAKLRTPKKGKK